MAKRLVVGSVAIDLFIQATGIVQRVQIGKGGKKQFVIAATPLTGDFIKELVEEKSGVMSPVLLPTIIPPRRWVNPYVGGYHMKTLRPIPLIKAYGPRGTNYLEELANRVDTMPMVYDAVNAVQATPWKINKALHDVMEQAYKGGWRLGTICRAPSTHPFRCNQSISPRMERRGRYGPDRPRRFIAATPNDSVGESNWIR